MIHRQTLLTLVLIFSTALSSNTFASQLVFCGACSPAAQKQITEKYLKRSGETLLIYIKSNQTMVKWGLTQTGNGGHHEGEGSGDYSVYQGVKLNNIPSTQQALKSSIDNYIAAEKAFAKSSADDTFYINVNRSALAATASTALNEYTRQSYYTIVSDILAGWGIEYSRFRNAVADYRKKMNTSSTQTASVPYFSYAVSKVPGKIHFKVVVTHKDGSTVILLLDIRKALNVGKVAAGFSVLSAKDANGNSIALGNDSLILMDGFDYYGNDNVNGLNQLLRTYDNVRLHHVCGAETTRMHCGGAVKTLDDGSVKYILTCSTYSESVCGGQ